MSTDRRTGSDWLRAQRRAARRAELLKLPKAELVAMLRRRSAQSTAAEFRDPKEAIVEAILDYEFE